MPRPLKFPTVDSWLLAQLQRLNDTWDNWHLNTGEEGSWKSLWSRQIGRRLDFLMRTPGALVQLERDGPHTPIREHWTPSFPLPKPFTLEDICFGQDALLTRLATLEFYGVAVGDEIEGHKRLAMHGHRQILLDHTKEARFFCHNVILNYPHVDQFESDLFRTRLKWWTHHLSRGHVIIRERPPGVPVFDAKARVSMLVKWPVVGEFTWEPGPDPWRGPYDQKKLVRARERLRLRLEEAGITAAPETKGPKPGGIDPRILDMILAETKKQD